MHIPFLRWSLVALAFTAVSVASRADGAIPDAQTVLNQSCAGLHALRTEVLTAKGEMLKQKLAALEDCTSLLKASLDKWKGHKAPDSDLAGLEVEIEANRKLLNENEASTVAEKIGKSPRPLTAVLFAPAFKADSYEIVKDPLSQNAMMGKITQRGSGGTAGILVAAEAPFSYLRLSKGRYLPMGAWFGVQLQTGRNRNIDSVDVAAGLSLTLVSPARTSKYLESGPGESSEQPARLLFGLIYGTVKSLGGGLREGDSYPLGEALPMKERGCLAFTFGLGFRF
jgi:hypothetical protein